MKVDLLTPLTEPEIASLIEGLNKAGLVESGLVVRRLAWQRDELQAEIQQLQAERDLHELAWARLSTAEQAELRKAAEVEE